MEYVIALLFGVVGGAACMFIWLELKRKTLANQKLEQTAQAGRLQVMFQSLESRQSVMNEDIARMYAAQTEFNSRAITYKNLADENVMLKRDLRNVDVNIRKLELDREQQRQQQEVLDQKAGELGSRYLKENVKWIGSSLNDNNFVNCKRRLIDAIKRCREIGHEVSPSEEASLIADLEADYRRAVRAAFEREEQARIKAQIREEQARQREIDREILQLEREREAIKAALEKALAEARDQHSEEVERLRERLAEAEAKSQRAISQAQITKAGHVYIISNLGSFGEGVFKIGMTRRLEPYQRVYELGSASVPFTYDVHMMISADDAPGLENALHRKLHKLRLNKANPRKEFFRTTIESIAQIVQELHSEVDYVADAEAIEFRQTLSMTDEDEVFIESVYDELEEDQVEQEA